MRHYPISTAHIFTGAVVLLILFLAIYASLYLSQQAVVVSLLADWGYVAVAVAGLVSGLNAIVPIPAATLTPLFTAAGLSTVGIIAALVAGTLLADFIGFLLGTSTKSLVAHRYPRLVAFITNLTTTRRRWLTPVVVAYAAFVPIPNEALLIPLAFSGIGFGRLLIPLALGNAINQTLLVYGVDLLTSVL